MSIKIRNYLNLHIFICHKCLHFFSYCLEFRAYFIFPMLFQWWFARCFFLARIIVLTITNQIIERILKTIYFFFIKPWSLQSNQVKNPFLYITLGLQKRWVEAKRKKINQCRSNTCAITFHCVIKWSLSNWTQFLTHTKCKIKWKIIRNYSSITVKIISREQAKKSLFTFCILWRNRSSENFAVSFTVDAQYNI